MERRGGALADCRLVFALGDREYAVRATQVGCVLDPGPLRAVPGAPREILGLCEWQGALLTVIDLPRLLGLSDRAGPRRLLRLTPPLEYTALAVPARLRWETSGTPHGARLVDPGRATVGLEARMRSRG